MIVRMIRKVFGLKKNEIKDVVYYNSKENINNNHSDIEYFNKILKSTKKSSFEFLKVITKHNLLTSNQSIIDIGCGSGNILNLISSAFPNNKLIGTDFSEVKMENCSKVYPHIQFRVHDIYHSIDEKYDLVLCTEVLEHLLYPHKAIKKLIEGIDDNGVLFVSIPNGRLDTFSGHIHFWSIESWNLFLEENLPNEYQTEVGLFSDNRLIYTIIRKNSGIKE